MIPIPITARADPPYHRTDFRICVCCVLGSRKCGKVVCADCSPHRLSFQNERQLVRVCNTCNDAIAARTLSGSGWRMRSCSYDGDVVACGV